MQVATLIAIKNNPNLYRYLQENSYWYKYLNRSPIYLEQMMEQMKEAYHLTPAAKMENIAKTMNLVKNFMDIIN